MKAINRWIAAMLLLSAISAITIAQTVTDKKTLTIAGANISIGKARTAVLFKRPTKVFEDIIKNGRTAMVALPDSLFTPLQGGIPIVVDGQIVGGVGVSGASSAQQDEELAIAGANV